MPTESNRPERHDQRLIGQRIGRNNANNEFASDAVVANADGSVLERLEDVKDRIDTADGNVDSILAAVGADSSLSTAVQVPYGRRVTKVGDISGTTDQLFTITGKVLITLMVGEVTSVLATSSSLSLNTSTNDQVISASTQVTSDALGTLYMVSGDPDLGLNGGDTPGVDAAFMKVGTLAPFMMNDDAIEQNVNGAGTGLIQWDLWYIPLEASASVASAA